MYHEFGHDVYKYEHSTDRADIMFPASTRGDININDFIEAKDRMFKRSFPGIKYIPCPHKVKNLNISIYFFAFYRMFKKTLLYMKKSQLKYFIVALIMSKVTDPNFDSDDLYAFWDIFVADAKCSMSSSPEYDKLNTDVYIFYEYESDALFASGEVLDYGAYAASSCDDSRVRVGIAFRYWNDINIWQKLGLMYHEFGHDVLRYGHSSNPEDIMHASSPFASTYNGFIESKNRFFDKKFEGLRYLDCSWYEGYVNGISEPNIPHIYMIARKIIINYSLCGHLTKGFIILNHIGGISDNNIEVGYPCGK